MAELPDRDASDRVLTATDLSELERPSKRRKGGKFSSENEGGVDDSRSNAFKFTWDGTGLYMDLSGNLQLAPASLLEDKDWDGTGYVDFSGNFQFVLDLLADAGCPLFLESEGRVDDSWSNAHNYKWDGTGLYIDLSGDWQLPSGLLLDNESSFEFHWDGTGVYLDFLGNFQLVWDLLADSGCALFLENKGRVDREDNHDDHVSSENEDGLPNGRSCDDQLSKPKNTLPMSSTEIGKESNEISGVEGSCEVRSVAGNCPVRHPSAVQLKASSSKSDCLDVNLLMEGHHPSPLLLWSRNRLSQPIYCPTVGTIFGNCKPENVLLIEQLFGVQLYPIENNPFLSTPEAKDLFLRLLMENPELRPEVREVLLHPFFWNSSKKLCFLLWINWRLRSKNLKRNPLLLKEFMSNEPPVFNGNWIDNIHRKFKADIRKRRDYYDYSSVMGLLKFMRNKHAHHKELPKKLKKLVGWDDESFYNYFAAQFPGLLMKAYRAASQFCREEKWFKEFHRSVTSSKVAVAPSDPLAAW